MAEKKLRDWHKHDERLVQNLSGKKFFPSLKQIKFISEYLSKTEKLIIRVLSGIAIIAVFALFINIYWNNSSLVADYGGTYTEGLVGSPHYINPLFSTANDVDSDLTALVYSGLLKYNNGALDKDLAESFEISADQKEYTFALSSNNLSRIFETIF